MSLFIVSVSWQNGRAWLLCPWTQHNFYSLYPINPIPEASIYLFPLSAVSADHGLRVLFLVCSVIFGCVLHIVHSRAFKSLFPMEMVLLGWTLPSPTCLVLGEKSHSTGPLWALRCAPWQTVAWLIGDITTVCHVQPWSDDINMEDRWSIIAEKDDEGLAAVAESAIVICTHYSPNILTLLSLLFKHLFPA